MALETGQTIGQYEIVGEIGEGGMAVVYHARHAVLGSDHAIKVLHERFIRQDEIRQRFLEEGRIQAQLRHPNIVPVTDILAAPGVAGLVMPLVQGSDLADLLEWHGAVQVEEATAWISQILLALAYVHERGIIHRDLKPANIFIEQLPRRKIVRVMDFGIAKVLDKSRTRTAAMMGTPAYMSPEQIRSPAHVDARTDLFAVGSILYEMLTGSPAFDGDTQFDIQTRIVEGRFTPLRDRRRSLPGHFDAIVLKALARDPDQRFASANEFLDAIEEPAAFEPTPAPAPAPTPDPAPEPEPAPAPAPEPASTPELAPERVRVPFQEPQSKPRRRPIEFGIFSIGRRNRLIMAFFAMCVGGLVGGVLVPLALDSLNDPTTYDVISKEGMAVVSAGVMGGMGAVAGYWFFELGCLLLMGIIVSGVSIILIEVGAA